MMGLIGLLLWVLVTVTVLGFLFWSTFIALAQKKAWSEFAKRYKLSIEQGDRFRDPVSVTGTLNGRLINIYSEIEQNIEERTQRIYTHVEVFLTKPAKSMFVIAKNSLPDSMQELAQTQIFAPTSKEWPMPAASFAADVAAVAEWMTPSRMATLGRFLAITEKGVDAMLMGSGETSFLLWRGQKPLTDPRELNALVQKLYGFAREFDGIETGASTNPNASSDAAPADKPA